MRTVLEAAALPSGSREEHWRQTLDDNLGSLDLRLDEPPDADRIVMGELGPLRRVQGTGRRP